MTQEAKPPEVQDEAVSQVQVLLVDDEIDILSLISDALNDRGVTSFSAESGEQAIEAYRKLRPRLIVSDYNMPGLNGLELFKFLRDLGNRAPVIWLTGNSTRAITREAWLRGVLNIFQKPFDVDSLVDHCCEYLNMRPQEIIELRPKFLDNIVFKNLSIDLDKSLYESLQKKCLEVSISMSRYVSSLVEQSLKEDLEKALVQND